MYTITKQGSVLFQGTFVEMEREAIEQARRASDELRKEMDGRMALLGWEFSRETILHDEIVREYRRPPVTPEAAWLAEPIRVDAGPRHR